MILISIVLLLIGVQTASAISAFDIRWGTDLNSNMASNTLKQWAEGIEGRVGSNIGTGNIYYVDSNVTVEGDGKSWANARNTLDEAVGLCTADNGDVIFLAPGHTETLGAAANEVDIDVAGVKVFAIGSGKLRALFDFTAATTTAFVIGADDVSVINCQFLANVTDVPEAIAIEAGAEQVTISNCLFYANLEGTDEFLVCIDSQGAASDRLTVTNCHFAMGAGAAVAAIQTLDSDYSIIASNIVFGDYSTACIYNKTTASNHIVIAGNLLFNGTIGAAGGLNTEPCIELVATTTGIVADNYVACNVAVDDDAIIGVAMFLFENMYSETASSTVGIKTAAGS